jgi:hypothetical protein
VWRLPDAAWRLPDDPATGLGVVPGEVRSTPRTSRMTARSILPVGSGAPVVEASSPPLVAVNVGRARYTSVAGSGLTIAPTSPSSTSASAFRRRRRPGWLRGPTGAPRR